MCEFSEHEPYNFVSIGECSHYTTKRRVVCHCDLNGYASGCIPIVQPLGWLLVLGKRGDVQDAISSKRKVVRHDLQIRHDVFIPRSGYLYHSSVGVWARVVGTTSHGANLD
jgi:hypothetical protein